MLSHVLLICALLCAQSAAQLLPWKAIPLASGTVFPTGWLQRELRVQADGFGNNLQLFWEPINNTQWLGGTSTQFDWTDLFPYMLNAYVGQAIQLNDTAQLKQAQAWLEYVLAGQEPNGWLGPTSQPAQTGKIYWPRCPMMAAFFQWYEYTGDFRFINASIAWVHHASDLIKAGTPKIGFDYTGVRWQEMLWTNQYLMNVAPASELPFLTQFSADIYSIGRAIVDYEEKWYIDPANGGEFPTGAVPGPRTNLTNHGVNNAMASKSGAVVYRMQLNADGAVSSHTRLGLFDKYHGTPSGMWQADEHLAGNMPSHGTETCSVVEFAYSMNVVYEILGDAVFAERAEQLTYNALPAAMTKDFWARVYLQQPNEPIAVSQNPHVWISDGDTSIRYSLDDNWGCCTPNVLQGWPKFIQKMIHASPDGGVIISSLGPVVATLPSGAMVNVSGDYPFDDILTITITAASVTASGSLRGRSQNGRRDFDGPEAFMPVYVRIPFWATAATMSINGGAAFSVGAANGTVYQVPNIPGGNIVTISFDTAPAIYVDTWYNGAVAVHRGALLYALQLEEVFTVLAKHGLLSNTYNITQPGGYKTVLPWNAALVLDPANPGATLTYKKLGPVPALPYSSTNQTNIMQAKARVVKTWGFAADGSAQPPPLSPVDCSGNNCGPVIDVVLVPLGTTHLRMTELPYTAN